MAVNHETVGMNLNKSYLTPAFKAIKFTDIIGLNSGYDKAAFFLVALG